MEFRAEMRQGKEHATAKVLKLARYEKPYAFKQKGNEEQAAFNTKLDETTVEAEAEAKLMKNDLEGKIETVRDFWRNKIVEGASRSGQILRNALTKIICKNIILRHICHLSCVHSEFFGNKFYLHISC